MIIDDILAVLPELRAQNDSLLVDLGQIARPGTPVFDPGTGLVTAPESIVHTGPCRMRQPNGIAEAERLFGEQQVTASRFIACWPHTVTGIRIDDIVTLLETDDTDLIGRRFRILAIPMTSIALYKGFPCEAVE